jgi:hypothetical protein
MVIASSDAYLTNLITMKVLSMDLSDIKLKNKFEGIATPLSIFCYYGMTMRRSLTSIVTSIRWDKMGYGEGHPEVYAATWFYKVDITIYSQEYNEIGGSLTFKVDGLRGSNVGASCPIWHILYHGNNHFNSICLLDVCYWTSWYSSDVNRHALGLLRALEDHHHNFLQLTNEAITSGCLLSPNTIEPTRAATCLIMAHIAYQLSTAGGRNILDSQLETLCNQAEEQAALPHQPTPDASIPPTPMQPAIACYKAELQAVINKHQENFFQLLTHGEPKTCFLIQGTPERSFPNYDWLGHINVTPGRGGNFTE